MAAFPAVVPLREHWREIRAEAMRLFEAGHIRASERHDDLGFNTFFRKGWKRFYLKWYGEPLPSAKALCPRTVELVESIPSVHGAMFALIGPQSKVGEHRDPFAGSLRYHLGLITPNRDECRIFIDDNEDRALRPGRRELEKAPVPLPDVRVLPPAELPVELRRAFDVGDRDDDHLELHVHVGALAQTESGGQCRIERTDTSAHSGRNRGFQRPRTEGQRVCARSLHVLTAVDGDVGAGDERRLVGAEIDDQARDLLRLAEAAHRDLRDDLRRPAFPSESPSPSSSRCSPG